MKQRGRKTISTLRAVESIEVTPRQPPPAELSELEVGIWLSITNTKPADWFQADTEQLLVAYCKHASVAMIIDKQLDEFEPSWLSKDEGLDRYRKLTDLREKQTRVISALSRAMRLTQQSKYGPRKAHSLDMKSGGHRPWEC
jgi:hypothetical protein